MHTYDTFVSVDTLHPGQQYFSHFWKHLPRLNHASPSRVKCHAQEHIRLPKVSQVRLELATSQS